MPESNDTRPAGTEAEGETTTVEMEEAPSENHLVHEHLQRMPTLISRGLLYLIIAVIAVSVIYGYTATVDIVIESQAVVRTTSPEMTVTSSRSGYIEKIFVSEGDTVSEGDPLFLLRSEKTVSYRNKIESLKEKLPLKKELYNSKIRARQNRLDRIQAEQRSALKIKQLRIDQNQSTIQSLKSDLDYWKSRVTSLKDEFQRTKSLYEEQLTSIREFNRIKNELERARSEVEKLRSELEIKSQRNQILREEIQELKQQFQQKEASLRQEIENLRIEKKSTLQSLRNEIRSTRNLLNLDVADTQNLNLTGMEENLVRAPGSGVVTGLRFKSSGQFITSAQRLCNILPMDSELYMEVRVRNRDIGFIEEGMEVKYKFDAFPYRDYGLRHGTVQWVSPSAVETQQGMVYKLEASLKKNHYTVDGKSYPIKPGMTATAELVTESKSIAGMLLSKVKG